jgi:hypothetical protein
MPSARLFLLVLALGALALGVFLAARAWAAAPFPVEILRQYESELLAPVAGEAAAGEIPPRTGKVVLVRPSSWQVFREGTLSAAHIAPERKERAEKEIDPPRLDDSWRHLDAALRAASADEADTVIFCDYRKIPVAEYQGTANFYGTYPSALKGVYLKAFDRKSRRFLGECLLAERDPRLEAQAAGEYSGDPRSIARFVSKMPLRSSP